jgi:heme/copper-type cytochrome/quinol oxidase subunit 3
VTMSDTVRRQHRQVAVAETALPRWVGAALVLLGGGIVACVVLGPLVLDLMVYRVSESARRQVIGVDATGLFVVAPVSIAVGVTVLRGRRNLVPLGLAPAVFAAYTYTQLFVGNEYLHRPGNVEKFSPLLLATFVLALAVIVGVTNLWSNMPLPRTSPHTDRVAGVTMLLIAAFVVVGIHLPSYVDAISAHPTGQGYLADPTVFWLVKFIDLGLLTPAAVTVGVGMLRGRQWALRPMYAIVGGYALLGISVAAMAVEMYVSGDPDGSLGMVLASGVAATSLVLLAGYLYRPLFNWRSN